ncbi:MAG: hypothetical protein JRJ69_07865 [Deltaproteobacteria bacterium]|nr:hypothetical protein [Deltaproteobacteria bacterium]MBW1737456.1 hypothetical protein [Deltaproteobacteria bacterium]MBW1907914.1 hypothetical protein [Deltaproteobacteria bacterium]MBW2032453.1 hypothetical protein [Deltaproteobacteria bacterium]MBW2114121.1 hypothetical protein [Deltaproteobacteria bacterium]
MAKSKKNKIHEAEENLFIVEGHLKYHLARLGDKIAKDQGYSHLDGLEAVYRYLIDKYNWLPDQVKRLSVYDLKMLLDDYEKR